MMEITLHVNIPALDRLAQVLESRQVENTVVTALPAVEAPQAAPEAPQAAVEAAPVVEPKETPKEEPAAQEEPKTTIYTLDQVQRAAAKMRDQGKLGAVTGMFAEFGIKKLSDLNGDKLQTFAQRLIGLGASL